MYLIKTISLISDANKEENAEKIIKRIRTAANLAYLAPPPQDNFSWVSNCSVGPTKCEK